MPRKKEVTESPKKEALRATVQGRILGQDDAVTHHDGLPLPSTVETVSYPPVRLPDVSSITLASAISEISSSEPGEFFLFCRDQSKGGVLSAIVGKSTQDKLEAALLSEALVSTVYITPPDVTALLNDLAMQNHLFHV